MHITAARQASLRLSPVGKMPPPPQQQEINLPAVERRGLEESAPDAHAATIWQQRCQEYLSEPQTLAMTAPTAYFNPGSPLFQATMPSADDIGQQIWRRLLPNAYSSPGHHLICLLYRLQQPLSSARSLQQPDEASKRLLDNVEMELLRRNPDSFAAADTFTPMRFARQGLAYEALRLTGLVLVCAASLIRCPTQMARSRQDHGMMQLFMLDIDALVELSPEVALWTLCIAGPYTDMFLRRRVVGWLSDLSLRLRLGSWPQVRSYLARQLYYAAIQDPGCPMLWSEVELNVREMETPAEEISSSPPEAPVTPRRDAHAVSLPYRAGKHHQVDGE